MPSCTFAAGTGPAVRQSLPPPSLKTFMVPPSIRSFCTVDVKAYVAIRVRVVVAVPVARPVDAIMAYAGSSAGPLPAVQPSRLAAAHVTSPLGGLLAR